MLAMGHCMCGIEDDGMDTLVFSWIIVEEGRIEVGNEIGVI